MDFGMWRRVLFVLMVVGRGVLAADGTNKDVFEKLCEITKGVKGLMEQSGEHNGLLKEALYGRNWRDPFEGNGRFTGGCGLVYPGLRSQYCSHLTGYPPKGSGKHGCFGDSLLGTLLCTCVPGHRQEKDFCGLGNVTDGASWTSRTGSEQSLFQKVWNKTKQKCMGNNISTTHTTGHLENLKRAVKDIHEEAKKKNGSGHFTLGGSSSHGQCGGTNPGHACVTYAPKSDNGNTPHIPWAEKILTAIEKFNQTRTQRHSSTSSSGSETDNDHEDPSDDSAESNDDGEEEEEEVEESPENNGSNNTSNQPRSKRRRTKKPAAKKTEKTLKAILHDDGTLLTPPFLWSLSAVVIF